jgi:hypothetical protein
VRKPTPGYGFEVTEPSSAHPNDRFLSIYINDHRAASAGGLALAQRCVRASDPGAVRDVLEAVTKEIAEDKDTLERVAQSLGVRANPVKTGAARLAEVAARLKFNGQLRGYSPLSRLIERESLIAGIDAKRSLWLSLHTARRRELADFDFEHLAERASEQRARLVPIHRLAAAEALRNDEALTDGGAGRTVH